MRKNIPFALSILLLAASNTSAQYHNIRVDSVLSPQGRTPIAIATPIIIRFTNTGVTELNFPVAAWVRDADGNVIYRDTVNIPILQAGASIDTTWSPWTPEIFGSYTVCGGAFLPSDEDHSDDTTCASGQSLPLYDAEADSVVNPQPKQVLPEDSTWEPVALFSSVGVADLFDVRVLVVIYPISSRVPVFISDTTIQSLYNDQALVSQTFFADVGTYHISALPSGCYRLAAITQYPGDGNHLNDTAWTTFCIAASSVNDFENPTTLSMSPNPVLKSLIIRNVPVQTERIVTSNVLGQELIVMPNLTQSSLTLDLSDLPAGLYVVRFEYPAGFEVRRFIKE